MEVIFVIILFFLVVFIFGGMTSGGDSSETRSDFDSFRSKEQRRPSSQVFDNLQVKGKKQSKAQIFDEPEWVRGVNVDYVVDGDTVDVAWNGGILIVRLYGIDCPEDGQEWGDIATAGLIKMIGGKSVDLEIFGTDMYDRVLATIFVQDGSEQINVNEKMVMKGHAWVMRRFYNELPKNRQHQLNKLENWAKSKKVGLWRNGNPIPPWKWRQEG